MGDRDDTGTGNPMVTGPRAEVDRLLGQLGEDELRVVGFVAACLVGGRTAYGPLDVATDRRDWRRERDEELADALVYAACEALRRDLGGPR